AAGEGPRRRTLIFILGLALTATLGFRIHLLADLQRDQPLHVGNIRERPRQVAMLRIALPKMLDRAREKLERLAVAALAAHHTAVRGINVAERNVVVGRAQNGFRLVEDARRFPSLAFLKLQPAFQRPPNPPPRLVAKD